jgi:predicted phage terminase large subunit-like protein
MTDPLLDVVATLTTDEISSMSPADQAVIHDALERQLLLRSPADFAAGLSHGAWKPYPHLVHISDAIVDMIEHDSCDLLIVEASVRHGKSWLCSHWAPAWFIAKYRKPVLLSSYEADFAATHGRRVREIIKEVGPRFGLEINETSRAANRWELNGGGGMGTAGAGGPLTGRGFSLGICVTGDSLVTTPCGMMRLDEAVADGISHVQAFDHATGEVVWAEVVASRYTGHRDDIYEIVTDGGRSLRCTHDHRIYVEGRGYVEAHLLQPGWRLRSVRDLRMQDQEASDEEVLPPVLSRNSSFRGPLQLRGLWRRGRAHARRLSQATQSVLLACVRWGGATSRPSLPVRAAPTARTQVLLDGMSVRARQLHSSGAEGMRVLHENVPATHNVQSVLLKDVCQSFACERDDGPGELELAARARLHGEVQASTARGQASRRWPMRGLRRDDQSARSPRRPRTEPRLDRESRDALQAVPHDPPQVTCDTVALVRPVREGAIAVYDLTVPATSNFFANGLLVHNCDDPVKNNEEANSPVMREHLWDWWQSTWITRREPGAKMLLIMSRWHVDDITGRLKKHAATLGMRIKVIRLPAIAEEDDELGRRPGEALCRERYDEEALAGIRKDVGPGPWMSLYQQRPIAVGGGMLKPDSLRYWTSETMNGETYYKLGDQYVLDDELWRFSTMDTAYTRNRTSDYTAIATWGVAPTDPYGLVLLNMQRRRVTHNDHAPMALEEWNTMKPAWVGVEKQMATLSLFDDLARQGVVVRWLTPDRNKVARAETAAAMMDAGRIWVPENAPWLPEFIDELSTFPLGKHDDQVDCLTYAVNELSKRAVSPRKVVREPTDASAVMWAKLQKRNKARHSKFHPVLGSGW